MQCGASALDKLHGLLASQFARSVVGACQIEQPPAYGKTSEWKRAYFDGTVKFSLWSDPLAAQVYSSERRPVQQLADVDDGHNSGWMSWHEMWCTLRHETSFTLIGAAFTFYWGPRTMMDQLFRAEWNASSEDGGRAGHPHWHCDCTVTGTDLDISRMHFAMGGWQRKGTTPECWQVFPTSVDELRTWAERTLDYCREQLKYYRPSVGTGTQL